MEALLKTGESSCKAEDVINFRRRLRDGCKVSYISNARVTEADADDWMAMPLLKEKETEATFSQRHFLLLHVPSLREFLNKFDALPPSQPAQTEVQPSIKVEEAPPVEQQRSMTPENGALPVELQRWIKLEEPDDDQPFESQPPIKLEEPEKVPLFDCHRWIKVEDPDIDTGSVLETSVVTSSIFSTTTEVDDVIDEEKKTSPSKKEEGGRTEYPPPPASTGSSYFEPDDEPPCEQRENESAITQTDLTQLSDFFFTNFAERMNGGDSERRPSFSFSSSPPRPPPCTFRIEPAPTVASSTTDATAAPIVDPTAMALINLLAHATAAAAAPAGETTTTHEQPSLSETVADLPLTRKVDAVAVKKQLTVQSPCPRCYVMIEKLDEARAHIEDASCVAIGTNACDVCAKRLASKWTLKKHLERHAEKPRCVFCSNRFDSLQELRDHNLLSGHMFRPEEAGAGSPEISALRKQRRKEQKDAIRSKETENNLATMLAVLGGATAAAAGKPPAKKRKTAIKLEDEAANAVAFLMEETVEGGNE